MDTNTSPSDEMTLERGFLLNSRYRIIEVLGQGGMAAVYRAIDENLGVEVAVKENLFTTDEYARQFRLEAVILANMRHQNLPRVTDHFVIEQQGQYLVMDYIDGEDLRQRMDRIGVIPEQEVIVIGIALSEALSYMHTRKPPVLHRDVKPGNVRITPQGHIYLVDFGLAKMMHGRQETTTGARAMTPGYSPPEQYGTARTDNRSDIYALGATLYSALTDALPEDGLARAMDQSVLTSIMTHNPRVSPRLAGAIEKALEVRPDQRYQSAEDFRLELLNCRSNSRRKVPLQLVLPPPPFEPVGQRGEGGSAPMDVQVLEAEEDHQALEEAAAYATPNGLQLAESNASPAQSLIKPRRNHPALFWLLSISLALLTLFLFSAYRNPGLPSQIVSWFLPNNSPVNESVDAFATSTQLALISDLGEITKSPTPSLTPPPPAEPTLTTTPRVTPTPTSTLMPSLTAGPTNTPTILATPLGGGTGQIVYASDRSGMPEVWIINIDGSGHTQLTHIAEGACQPDWSPDGTRIVFISPCPKNQDSYPGASLFIIDADGSNLTPLPSAPGGDYDPDWSPDGNKIVFTSLRDGGVARLYSINLKDNTVISLSGEESSNQQPDWSPDGEMIAYVGSDNRIWAMAYNGQEKYGLTVGGGDFRSFNPGWSPDGKTLVFSRRRADDTSGLSWLMAVPYTNEGALPVEIPSALLSSEASYSSDGFWLVFKNWTSGNHDIYIMRANGIDRQPLVTDESYDFDPCWRPPVIQP